MIVAALLLAALVVLCVSCQNEVEYVYEPSISVAAMPNKTSYFVGESLDLTGLRISCVQKDGSVIDVPESDYKTEPARGVKLEKAERTKVTVTYKSWTLSFEVAVSEVTASRLYLKTIPKRAYYDGESLDLSNVELTLLKTDGSEETISDFTAEPADGTSLFLPEETEGGVATRNVTLSYGDLSCSFDVSVYAKRLLSLAIKSPPVQTVYYVGDMLDMTGLEIEAAFSDGTVRNVTGECHISSEMTFTEEGTQTVTVSFLETECMFSVTVLQSFIVFCEQPRDIKMPLYAENKTLSAKVMPDCNGSIVFSWYRKLPNESEFTKIAESKPTDVVYAKECEDVLTLPKTNYLTAKYYCAATFIRGTLKNTVESAVATVVQMVDTGLPIIKITTVDGEEPTCNYRAAPPGEAGAGICDATKVPGRLVMTSGTETWYDSGEYDVNAKKGMTIKIRGNTSAYSEKKPYKIKLQKEAKADLLAKSNGRSDSKFEERDWILLKDGTSLNTFVGMTVADIAGTEWTPEFAFVNLVVNDDYRGVYLLIESIGRGDGRIDITKSGYVIERDAYWWNEQADGNPYFKTTQNKGYTFKYPDEDDITAGQIEYIKNYMNLVEASIADGKYTELIETDTFAQWLLVHDLLGTWDSYGSNVYITKYDNTDGSKIRMSTPWDFDSNYRMKNAWANIHADSHFFYMQPLLSSENTEFFDSYKAQWSVLNKGVWSELNEALSSLSARQGNAINASRRLDASRWSGTYTSVEENISTAEKWFAERIPWLEEQIKEM